MHEYMVIINFFVAFSEEYASLIPSQRNELNRLMEDGILTSYCLSSDRETLWITLLASSSEAVETMLKMMPLYKFMRYEIIELIFHNHPVYTPLQFSMN